MKTIKIKLILVFKLYKMYKQRFLSYVKILKYKEPINITNIEKKFNIKNINTIKKKDIIKNIDIKNIDINDINYSRNFWENIEKYKI